MLKRSVFVCGALFAMSLACNLASNLPATPASTAVAPLPEAASSTPTPLDTPTTTPTLLPTFTSTPLPSPTVTIVVDHPDPAVPTPLPVNRQMPDGQINILVLGSDYRPNKGFRTDTIMLVSINPNKGTVSAISIPRDLYVIIPGWTTNRINTALQHGGFEMMADTFDYNFGVRPDYYIMTNFQGFVGLVDSLGGISVKVGKYLSDDCDLPQETEGTCTFKPGVVKMDGQTALWYVRSRHSTSDYDRLRRSQEVLLALFTRMISLDALNKIPEFYNQYINSVETNMTFADMINLVPVASQVAIDPGRIKNFVFSYGVEARGFTTKTGADVQLPNFEAIDLLFDKAIFNQ